MLLRAFAKINLDLRILGKRSDGFHELRTIFQTIDWCDEIEIEPASQFEFSATEGPQDENNLVVQAVRAFEKASGKTANIRVWLHKHLPAGAGLGGGSADAAVTFLALSRFYGCQIDTGILRGLGSDVFFFTVGGRARGRGRGDEIEPLGDETDYWLVIVDPGFSINTAEAYSWLTVLDKSNNIEGFRAESLRPSEFATMVNDFEGPVFARRPQLKNIRDALLRNGAFRAALSGSGSILYGQFHTQRDAKRAASSLARRWSVKLTRPISRDEYFALLWE